MPGRQVRSPGRWRRSQGRFGDVTHVSSRRSSRRDHLIALLVMLGLVVLLVFWVLVAAH